MKKILILIALAAGMFGIACQSAKLAEVKLTNPDGKAVAFGGSIQSDMDEMKDLAGTTPATYEIEINPDADHVTASFTKTTINDTLERLRVELYYKGQLREAKEVNIPILEWAIVQCDIP